MLLNSDAWAACRRIIVKYHRTEPALLSGTFAPASSCMEQCVGTGMAKKAPTTPVAMSPLFYGCPLACPEEHRLFTELRIGTLGGQTIARSHA
jgi:hypothetical protein